MQAAINASDHAMWCISPQDCNLNPNYLVVTNELTESFILVVGAPTFCYHRMGKVYDKFPDLILVLGSPSGTITRSRVMAEY